jgi:hypothetical protein
MKIYAIYGHTPYENSDDAIALYLDKAVAERDLAQGDVIKGHYYEQYGVEEHEVSEEQS